MGLQTPEPQATTGELRKRFGRSSCLESRGSLVDQWCDWVGRGLGEKRLPPLVLHGDLHGDNVVWDPPSGALQLLADFESAGPGTRPSTSAISPGQADTVDLFGEVAHRYEQLSGRAAEPPAGDGLGTSDRPWATR